MKKYWYTRMLVGSLVAVKGGALISQGAGLETLLKQNSQQELLTESETPPMDLPISLNGGSEFPSSGGNSPALSKESEEDSTHETPQTSPQPVFHQNMLLIPKRTTLLQQFPKIIPPRPFQPRTLPPPKIPLPIPLHPLILVLPSLLEIRVLRA